MEDDIRIQLRIKKMERNDYEVGVIMELANTIITERLEREKRDLGKRKKIKLKS